MTELALGAYLALAIMVVIQMLASIIGYELRSTLQAVVLAQALSGGLLIVIYPYILAGFGG